MGFDGKGEGSNLRVVLGINWDERGGPEAGFIGGDELLRIWDSRVLEFEWKELQVQQ